MHKIKVKPSSVAILGFHDGNAGQVAEWFEHQIGYPIACFVHEHQNARQIDVEAENRKRVSQRVEFPTVDSFKGRPLLTAVDWPQRLLALGISRVLPMTSDNRLRHRQIEACHQNGLELISAVHPTATILDQAIVSPGVWISAGCIIGYKAEIASGVMINTGAQIDHHNVLDKCCQVGPGVVTAGNVTLRECCTVYTNATIINGREIGQDAIIGAGAVVIDDIPANATAVGVPAHVVKCERLTRS